MKYIKTILVFIFLLATNNIIYGADIKNVQIKLVDKSGYALYIDKKPLLLKGVIYSPTPIGQSYNYDFYSDPNKPWLVDGKLMKELGINCIRVYSVGPDLEKVKEFIQEMYEKFGIYTIVSDWLGLWNYPPANYSDKQFCDNTKTRVLNIVNILKDTPGLLLWILGNENNYTFSGKVGFWTSEEIEKLPDMQSRNRERARIYYTFINNLTKEIRKADPNHPIALGNGETNYLDIAKDACPDVDLVAMIVYRGKTFGNMIGAMKKIFNKPLLLSEFGCDSFDAYKEVPNEDVQSEFILSQWKEVYNNTVFSGNKDANCIGGVIFEWNDEWWKHNEGYEEDWIIHNTQAGWGQGAYYFDTKVKDGLNMNEEWFGLVSLSSESDSGINKRIPKKAYYSLKQFFSTINDKKIK